MKQQITILLITLLTASAATSQSTKDTTCLPNEQLKKVVNKLEYCKVLEQEIGASRELIIGQKEQLANKDSIIAVQLIKVSTLDKIISNATAVESNLKEIVENQKKQIRIKEKLIKKEKRTKFVTAAIGLIIGFLIAK